MKALPHVLLPEHLTLLLRANMISTGPLARELDQYIYRRRDLYELVRRSFPGVNQYGAVGKLVKVIGWQGFRDKIAAVYLNHMSTGSFDTEVDQLDLHDVLNIEKFLSANSIQSYSRGFLLGFYLKSAELSGAELDEKLSAQELLNDEQLQGMLKAMGSRVIKIDWLVLQLLHFRKYLGFSMLASMLNRACSYAEIFGELSMDQREELTINMLSYGASINESSIFVERPV
tara:strand:+ start:4255 stop:4944 length:690 start_codon:yes stop_codon:yes gene_type:complete